MTVMSYARALREALAEELPSATVRVVAPTTDDYDPHQCMHREAEGEAVFADWLGSFE